MKAGPQKYIPSVDIHLLDEQSLLRIDLVHCERHNSLNMRVNAPWKT
jgi:hypothetical protein